jgi:uncharacterized protein YjbK
LFYISEESTKLKSSARQESKEVALDEAEVVGLQESNILVEESKVLVEESNVPVEELKDLVKESNVLMESNVLV